jgi:hypothetical protein
LKIDRKGTNLEGKQMDRFEIERDIDDWFHCWIESDKYKCKFHGTRGPMNLEDM